MFEVLLPFISDNKVQQALREHMTVMNFLANLPLEFDTTKSNTLPKF